MSNETRERPASGAPVFTKRQLLKAKSLGLPKDAAAAVLQDGAEYTLEQARGLVNGFLKRKV